MSDIYVVYFSSTGNTEEMAKHVADGIERKGGNPILTEIGSADPDQKTLRVCGKCGLACSGKSEEDSGILAV